MTSPTPRSANGPADLVEKIMAGDREAEREMVARFSQGVAFILQRLTRDPARADDLHQETFRLALEKVRAGELRDPDKLAAFISQLARNLFIAEYRKAAKGPPLVDPETTSLQDTSSPGPLKQLLDKENLSIVRRLMAGLEPARDREILIRFFVAEHSKEEICADFGLTSLHFNRVLHRARGRLKDLILRFEKRQATPSIYGRPHRAGEGHE